MKVRRWTKRFGKEKRRAFILIAVLVVVMLASMVVVSLLFRVQAEETAAVAGAGFGQAWATAMSGVYEGMRIAADARPGSLEWQENSAAFRERLVFDDGSERWYFSVYSPNESSSDEVRFGLSDEAGKLNLNEATEAMLEKLPAVTPYIVQGLLDFLDSDDTPRPEGAEQEYYDALPVPYRVANGPLTTLDGLLLVRGFFPALLYGEDANWNFRLDGNEDDGDLQFPPDNKDGKLHRGLRPFLTVSSYDIDLDNAGNPRLDLNDDNDSLAVKDQLGSDEVPAALVTYIEALRRNKLRLEDPAELLEARSKFKGEDGKEVELESSVGKTELPIVLDRFTARTVTGRIQGLININTAPAVVLQTLPGVDEALADSMVATRRNLRDDQRRTAAWLYQEGVLDAAQFKKINRYLTARASQYHFHVVGYGVPSGQYRVLDVIIDTAGARPAIIYLRDITKLGLPFRIETGNEAPLSTESEAAFPQPKSSQASFLQVKSSPASASQIRFGFRPGQNHG